MLRRWFFHRPRFRLTLISQARPHPHPHPATHRRHHHRQHRSRWRDTIDGPVSITTMTLLIHRALAAQVLAHRPSVARWDLVWLIWPWENTAINVSIFAEFLLELIFRLIDCLTSSMIEAFIGSSVSLFCFYSLCSDKIIEFCLLKFIFCKFHWNRFSDIDLSILIGNCCVQISTTGSASSVASPTRAPVAGLTNLGNTCYMNSVIQALFATKSLRDFIVSGLASGSLYSGRSRPSLWWNHWTNHLSYDSLIKII